ncbi:DUF456 domain-containing protein [uncultured Treponema sp.]|uniref:DUF456 domain-containing protein n=1 Tax=uncultured Treponema sp. TaxID=162155 RepID=UPI0025FE568C|nr:DUF456 domain-containing protein [uncultured Treponema sp.]
MSFDPTIFFAVIAGFLLFLGFIGTFLPILPGPPLAWAGLLSAHFSAHSQISVTTLIITGFFALLITVADNIFPSLMTKKAGGSKAGVWGSTIGLIFGILFAPTVILIILGPFIGAFIGEMIHDSQDTGKALRAAFGAFTGFMLGTGIKMICVSAFIWIFVISLLK